MWKDHDGFLEDLPEALKKHEEEHNTGETQDTTDDRTTLQSQQDAVDVQEGAEGTGHGDG